MPPADGRPLLAPGRASTVWEIAPTATAASVTKDHVNAGVDAGNHEGPQAPSPEMLARAQELHAAAAAATRPQGPAEACLTQMKTIFCPIIGNMPFVRDVAGQVAMWGQFDCPTGTPPKG